MRTIDCLRVIAVLGLAAAPGVMRAESAADSASVTEFYGRWFGSASQGFTAYASFYASDGSILPPNAAPVVGRTAIAAWFDQARATATHTTQPQRIEVNEMRFMVPSWVVYRSTLRGQRIPKDGGPPVPFETKYFDLLHRLPAGGWEVVFRMWSDNR